MNNLSPLQRRAESIMLTHNRIAKFLEEVLTTPTIYREDVIEELKEAIERLSGKTLPSPKEEPLLRPTDSELMKSVEGNHQEAVTGKAKLSLRERILEVFHGNGNNPLSFNGLLETLKDSSRKAIQTVIYKRSFGQFMKSGIQRSSHAPVSLWCLTERGLSGKPDFTRHKPEGVDRKPETENKMTS